MNMQIGDCFLKSKRNEATDPNHTNKRLIMNMQIGDCFLKSKRNQATDPNHTNKTLIMNVCKDR